LAEPVVEAQPEPAPEPVAEPAPKPGVHGAREAEQARAARLLAAFERLAPTLERLASQPAPAPTAPVVDPPVPVPEAPRPTREAFADPDSYDSALIEWASQKAGRSAAAEATAAAQKAAEAAREAETKAAADKVAREAADELGRAWTEKQTAFVAEHPDYMEVAARDDLAISVAMSHAIANADNGPAIAYWLGQHREEAARIAAIANPVKVVMEIAKIEAKLAVPVPAPVSRAPAPPNPLRSQANAEPRDIYSIAAEGTTEDYAAARQKTMPGHRPFFPAGVDQTRH